MSARKAMAAQQILERLQYLLVRMPSARRNKAAVFGDIPGLITDVTLDAAAHVVFEYKAMFAPRPAVGQVWARRDGTTFTIEKLCGKYVSYWLSEGSHRQFREIRIDQLLKRYRLVKDVR